MPLAITFTDAYPHLQAGAQELTRLLADDVAARGHRARLVVPGLGPLPRDVARAGHRVVVVPAGRALAHFGGTTRGLRRVAALAALPAWWSRARRALRGSDLVQCNGQRGMVLFAPAARSLDLPVVYNRSTWPPSPRLDDLLLRIADSVVVPSPSLADDVRARAGVPVTVAPSWSPARGAPLPDEGEQRIAFVGRIHPDKGLDVLVDAVAHLHGQGHRVLVDVVGGADPLADGHLADLRNRVARAGLDDAVTFHGHLDEPWTVAGRATIYAQPSRARTESQGMALWQALSLGIPVVATDIPAFASVLEDGTSGRVVPEDDPRRLAAAIADLLADGDARRRLAREGRRRVAGWSRQDMVDGFVKAWSDVGVTV